MEKIDNVKRVLKKGELFSVPCITREEDNILYITPVINHPHNDIENGQKEIHYHADYRFVKHSNDSHFPTVINKHSKHFFVEEVRPQNRLHGTIEYFILPVINEEFVGITPSNFIVKSKLKRACIYNGKCPHRGYDLSQVKPIGGVITCPLHGLKFDEKTGICLLNINNGK